MPRGVPNNKNTEATEESPVIDMTATQVVSTDVDNEPSSPMAVELSSVAGEEGGPTATLVATSAEKSYYVLTLVNDHTRDLVKRLEKSGMDFQIVEMSENDMKDIRNGNLLFLPKS